MHLLCWTLALYLSDDLIGAKQKLRKTMLVNLYAILHLLSLEQQVFDILHPVQHG
jgi:hypothetical protein